MAGEFEVSFDDKEWRSFLSGLVSRANKADELLKRAFMTHGFQDIQDHFRQEEGPDGKWQRRAPSTQQMYANIREGRWKPPAGTRAGSYDPGNKVLQLTGRLRQSVVAGKNNIKPYGRNAIKVFSNVEYSGKHDEGEGHIPKREFMWLSSSAQDKMTVNILDGLLGERLGQ